MKKRILVCLTGASGAIYGVRLLRALKSNGHEVHLIISKWGEETLKYETGIDSETLAKEADFVYNEHDLAAGPASGTFPLDSVVVIPCSMKTLAGIAHGYADNLISRAADCSLKERRPLILVPRESPYNLIHIRNMAAVTEAGGMIIPACPAFWAKPKTIENLVDSVVERVLEHLGVSDNTRATWTGEL
ncbi:MAG: UbiX family flavin prenyltransferase [Candidatus Thorarchaeota archaeon]|nr:UbiX family flavin prenyltransferase [Candidatus Thorarchaeota archaeon]